MRLINDNYFCLYDTLSDLWFLIIFLITQKRQITVSFFVLMIYNKGK